MAVMIDMKLPESCCVCPFCRHGENKYDDDTYCVVKTVGAAVYANRLYYLSANKPIWCPIEPINNTQEDCEGCEAMEQYEQNKRGVTHITNIFM